MGFFFSEDKNFGPLMLYKLCFNFLQIFSKRLAWAFALSCPCLHLIPSETGKESWDENNFFLFLILQNAKCAMDILRWSLEASL